MKTSKILVSAAVSSILALGLGANLAQSAEMEKCYGVSKAGKNDCQTANSSCSGTASADGQDDAFVAVPKGLCDRLVGGSTKSG